MFRRATTRESVIKAAINDVVVRYCRAVDRGDWELMRSCYFPDARDEHLGWSGTRDELIEHLRAGMGLATYHCVLNHSVVIHDSTTVGSETYVVAYGRPTRDDGSSIDLTIGARYLDRFERRTGEWRIAHRSVIGDWVREAPVSEGAGLLGAGPTGFPVGAILGKPRADDDLSYTLLPKGEFTRLVR